MFTIKYNSRTRHCQYLKTKIGQIRPYRPHRVATRRLLIYITQQDDRDRVREHQQAVPPGPSEHRDAQPRPEQVLASKNIAPRILEPQSWRKITITAPGPI